MRESVKRTESLLFPFLVMISFASAGQAEQPDQSYRIAVTVISADRAPIYKATVSLLRNDSSIVGVEVTDVAGKAEFRSLPVGQYILRVTSISHVTILKTVDLTNKNPIEETLTLQ